jgi:hypothetical protein
LEVNQLPGLHLNGAQYAYDFISHCYCSADHGWIMPAGLNRFSASISAAICCIYTTTLQLEMISTTIFFSGYSSQRGSYIALLRTYKTEPNQISSQHAAAFK